MNNLFLKTSIVSKLVTFKQSFPSVKILSLFVDDGKFVIRMFSYIPGVTLKSCLQLVDSRCLLRELGSFIGKLHKTLQVGNQVEEMSLC